MLMLNKVRTFSDSEVRYEVVDFDFLKSNTLDIRTLDGVAIRKSLEDSQCDFGIVDDILLSTADSVAGGFDVDFKITYSNTIYNLLEELSNLGARYVSLDQWSKEKDLDALENPKFENLRISNSSMFVGFSVIEDNTPATHTLISVKDDVLQSKAFCIAVPKGTNIKTCSLVLKGSRTFLGDELDVYLYDNNLPLCADISGIDYMPLPVLNHCKLYVDVLQLAVDYLKDLNENKGLSMFNTRSNRSSGSAKERAIEIKGSILTTNKEGRATIFAKYLEHIEKGTELDFILSLPLLDRMALSMLNTFEFTDIDVRCHSIAKVNQARVTAALALMKLRVLILEKEYIFINGLCSVQCRGGGGGDEFHTILTKKRKV